MPLHWIGIILGALAGFGFGLFVGEAILAWRLRRTCESVGDWLEEIRETLYDRTRAERGTMEPKRVAHMRLNQLDVAFADVADLIGIERE